MKKFLRESLLVITMLFLMAGSSLATMPGEDVNPNGFPSGPHYNLNIIGKKAEFTCPAQEYDEFGNPIYGNVVFVPENGQGIQILMQSGKGKKVEAITELQAIDPCTAAFDEDAAIIQLPKNENGYKVYARALATPTANPYMTISPELVLVEDEYGNNLIELGLVTDGGFQKPGETFVRYKGRSIAKDITPLFLWTGSVCYFSDVTTAVTKCCVDTDLDGLYDQCVDPDPLLGTCPPNYVLEYVNCTDYVDTWVFNIGDFVEYLWSIDNSGVKLLQVRFYPQ